MKKNLMLLFAVLMLSSITTAQFIDSVLTTSTVNYPDAFIAAVVSAKIGAPLLMTEKDLIPVDTQDLLDELNPNKVYLIGGPEVISLEVEEEIKAQGYEVIRLWGITRYGTSTEVAKYFWVEGVDTAVLVSDKVGTPEGGNYELMPLAKDIAIIENGPLIISAEDVIPSVVEDTLVELSVQNVILVGFFTDDVKATLQDMGIQIIAEYGGDSGETPDLVENRTGVPLVIIAASNWQDTLNAPFVPGKGVSRLVKSEEQIQDVIDEINEGDYGRIKVVGKPELAQQICDALSAEEIEHDCLTGNAAKTAAQVAKQEMEKIQEIKQKFNEKKQLIWDKLAEKSGEIHGECAQYFNFANTTVSELGDVAGIEGYKNRVQTLQETRKECENGLSVGNITRRRDRLQQLKSEVNMIRWQLKDQIADEIDMELELETKSKSQIASKISEQVQELAQIRSELGDSSFGEQCRAQISEIEQLENEGQYSKIQSKIKIALKECSEAQNKEKGKGKP